MVPNKAGFRTLPQNFTLQSGFRFAALSCNDIATGKTIDPEHDLWNYLALQAEKDALHLLLHMGDQIYTDSNTVTEAGGTHIYDHAVQEVGSSGDPRVWQGAREFLVEMVRDEYRKTWTRQGTADTLANVSNVRERD